MCHQCHYDEEAESERKCYWGLVKSKPLCWISSEESQQCNRLHLLVRVKGQRWRNIPKIHIKIHIHTQQKPRSSKCSREVKQTSQFHSTAFPFAIYSVSLWHEPGCLVLENSFTPQPPNKEVIRQDGPSMAREALLRAAKARANSQSLHSFMVRGSILCCLFLDPNHWIGMYLGKLFCFEMESHHVTQSGFKLRWCCCPCGTCHCTQLEWTISEVWFMLCPETLALKTTAFFPSHF